MRKITIVLLLICSCQTSFGQIISQYAETESGSAPKGIEIWNNTTESLDFTTINLVIEKGTNGGVPAEDIVVSSGSLAPNAVMIIGTADMEVIANLNAVNFVLKAFTFNGDDALVVKYNNVITDVFGEPGSDPGSVWTNNGVSTANQNIQLISGITTGSLVGFSDPSLRFETVSETPSLVDGLEGFGIAPLQPANIEIIITEVFSGQTGDLLTPDWFEIKNTGTTTWNATTNGELFYDDDSADATTADVVQGFSTLAPNEFAIVLITNDPIEVTNFINIWGQVIDLSNVQIGYSNGAGLGGGGDTVNLWLGTPADSAPIASASYPSTAMNNAQTYDVELNAFSVVSNESGAVTTILGGGNNGDTPNIGSPGNGNSIPVITITEIHSGQAGAVLTPDWFEIKNISSVTWDASLSGNLYYDDESADASTADLVQGIVTLDANEYAIVLITDNQTDVDDFISIWGQVIDLSNIQIGYADGAGLGGGGDTVNLWLGDPTVSNPIAVGTYPDTALNDAQSYDLELNEFSLVDNANGAVATLLGGGVNGDVPNIGSPGNGNFVPPVLVSFNSSFTSAQENISQITVAVTLSEAANSDISFDLNLLQGGSASVGDDFDFTNQSVTILAGETTANFTVAIIDNSQDSEDVFFVIELTNLSNALIGDNQLFAVYILDDDNEAPVVSPNILDISLISSYLVDENGTAEISAFDAISQRLFVVNNSFVEFLDFSDPNNLLTLGQIDVAPYGSGAQSVAIYNGLVAIAVANQESTENGFILFTDFEGNNIQTVEVGSLPDMITFTPDGSKLLVANEGEPNADYSIDPEGSVSVVDVTGGLGNISQADVQTLNFNAFDNQLNDLVSNGIRIFGPNASVSQDLEPEYITVSDDSNRAFVVLQENNAYAIVNLLTSEIESIMPLGLKDHSLTENSLDVSVATDFIFDATWPVKGMYMPDGIANYIHDGVTYLVTANEGDAREYDTFAEEVNLGDVDYNLDPSVFSNEMVLALETNLASISITNASGDANGDGLYEEIHVFGGRSFSIFEAETGNLVFDSGHDFERIVANDPVYAAIFNASNTNNSFKNRSGDKGVEPEGVIVQEINGVTYAFITLERMGGMMVYDISNPFEPQFIDYKNNRDATPDAEASGDLGPEGIIYIAPSKNELNKGLIVISNEISATISVYAINTDVLNRDNFASNSNIFKTYPNPVTSKLYLTNPSDYSIYDLNGRLINTYQNTNSIEVSSLKAGIYIIKAATGQSEKFVKL
jgi:hypothetical protein